jgi:glutamate carboxypeptidase
MKQSFFRFCRSSFNWGAISVLLCLGWTKAQTTQKSQPPTTLLEQKMVSVIDAHMTEDQELLKELVDINSGTMHFAGVEAVKDVLVPKLQSLGFQVRWVPMQSRTNRVGDLVAEHSCPNGEGRCGKRMLLIGHMDTVFEPSSTFQKYTIVSGTGGKVATGPGVGDMKGGLVIMLSALGAMRVTGVLDHAEIRIVLSGDEENVGMPIEASRRDMIEAAKHSDVALEFEPSSRINGQDTVSVGRRSLTMWHVETSGLSGHSSQIFGTQLGYGAVFEMARIIDTFRRELPEDGLTFSPGLILGGATSVVNSDASGGSAAGKPNVIAASAQAFGDFRTLTNEQILSIETKMRSIVAAHLPQTNAKISFDGSYPAMAGTPAGRKLMQQWSDISVALGSGSVGVAGVMTRGGGDIAFVAPLVPGLVGVGILGEGYHAEGEKAYLDSIAPQAKRNAVLMERLTQEPSGVAATEIRDELMAKRGE